MRPDVGDILAAVQQGLMEQVMPEITNPHVMERVALMLMMLDHCMKRWDRVYAFVWEEHEDLRGALKKIAGERTQSGAGGEIEAALREISALAADAEPEEAPPGSSVTLREHSDRAREALSRLLHALASEDLDKNPTLRSVRAHAAAYIRRQIARDREWVQAGEIVW
jgi:hypothetical protein